MLLVRSCSPAEIKILVPVMLYEPSILGSALVRRAPRSDPQCASVRHMVPVHSPLIILVRYVCFCSSVPCSSRVLIAPWLKPGYMPHDQLAVPFISLITIPRELGKPCPP